MASKYNITIDNKDGGSIIMGDQNQVDIGAGGRVERVRPRNEAFAVPKQPVGYENVGGSSFIPSMKHKITQGFALILHNQYFLNDKTPDRVGSEKDVEEIKKFCKTAGLDINDTDRETENLKASEMENLCSEISKRDFSRYDGFVCFILSHGDENGIYGVDDEIISIQKIVSMFRDCTGLAGKPKLFFVQACRGKNKDMGISIDADSRPVNLPKIPLVLPTKSDVLIAHSTMEGYESYRNRLHGSWFIITLMEELQSHAHHMHIMDILTIVNNAISGYKTPEDHKQMPCQLTTLTKFVYFKYPAPLI
ncbi:caspase-3-like [Xenia sp. Carnegie-2017]|uniref:caspase-3-like n=1 Tax=Xenia sp. Carnegie-2017 TaxID=2897299 RepID=UPI001F04AB69|nr:caspase-3-like [Xenia sp. Carnegie-2017]